MRRVAIFNYDSIFAEDIRKVILHYNRLHPEDTFWIDIYRSCDCLCESTAGPADLIIHSGGDGIPVKEDATGVPKLYICHSHQWKAEAEGGKLVRLEGYRKGIKFIDLLEDDEILGRKGRMPIMQYHSLAVLQAPSSAKILATSRVVDYNGEEIQIIEALKYPDGSLGIQGHPEEGTAVHIFYNYFEKIKRLSYLQVTSRLNGMCLSSDG